MKNNSLNNDIDLSIKDSYNNQYLHSSNSISNNNNKTYSYNNDKNTILFFKIYHNLYLKSLIFKYMKIYNIYSSVREFKTVESFNQFKYKEYLSHIKIIINSGDEEILQFSNILTNNIKELDLYFKVHKRKAQLYDKLNTDIYQDSIYNIQIPEWIKSVKIIDCYRLPNRCIFYNSSGPSRELSNLHTLEAELQEILPNSLPKSIQKLVLNQYWWELRKDSLPPSLTSLYIEFNGAKIDGVFEDMDGSDYISGGISIHEGALPDTLTELKIRGSFDYKIKKGTFPSSLKYLTIITPCEDQLKENCFPDSLVYLDFQLNELNIKLPNSLKKLIVSVNKELEPDYQLPSSLEYLDIDAPKAVTHYNIPNNLLDLKFGYELDPPLVDKYGFSIIPESIRSVEFGFFFSQSLEPIVFDGCRNLKSISFGLNFNSRLLPNVFPETVTSITFKNFDNGGFSLVENNYRFPHCLEYIDFGIMFDQVIGENTFSKLGCLKTIKFGSAFKQMISNNSIPSSVEVIELLNTNYQHSFQLPNPDKTNVILKIHKRVILQSPFKDIISSIEYTDTGYFDNLNEYHYESFPITLKHLKLPFNFNEPIKILSLNNKSKLESLEFDSSFNQPLLKQDLPINNSIKVLVLGQNYSQEINLEYFKNLEILKIFGNPIIITTKNNNNNSTNNTNVTIRSSSISQDCAMKDYSNENQDDYENQEYIFYNLQVIETPVNNIRFLNSLNPIYFQFIHLLKPTL